MPIDVAVDVGRGAIQMRYGRSPTFEEWRAAMDAVLATPGLPKRLGFLVDRRRAEAPTADFVRATTLYVVSRLDELERSRWALVVTSPPVSYGIARMWQALADNHAIGVRVFEDIATAERWLDTGVGGSKPILKVVT